MKLDGLIEKIAFALHIVSIVSAYGFTKTPFADIPLSGFC